MRRRQSAAGRPASRQPAAANQVTTTVDTKQRGRWLLHEARSSFTWAITTLAQQKVDEAEALDIKWGLFDDTPAKVTEEIKKARPEDRGARRANRGDQPHDRRTARAKLRGSAVLRSTIASSSRPKRSRSTSRAGA